MTATAAPPEATDEVPAGEMTLVEHLTELRSRLFKAALAVVGGFMVGFVFRNQVIDILKAPYCDLPAQIRLGALSQAGQGCELVFLDVTGGFLVSVKAAAMVAVILAAPVVFYQLWRFVTPGLRPVERRYAIPFVVFTQLLFAGGAVFSYFLIPRALEFLLGFTPGLVSIMDANKYLKFVLQTMIAFGISFEFPLVLILLSLTGVVTSQGLRRVRRYALFGTFVASAVITPTQDPLTMLLMAGPLVLFYEVSILAARLIERGRARSEVTGSKVATRA